MKEREREREAAAAVLGCSSGAVQLSSSTQGTGSRANSLAHQSRSEGISQHLTVSRQVCSSYQATRKEQSTRTIQVSQEYPSKYQCNRVCVCVCREAIKERRLLLPLLVVVVAAAAAAALLLLAFLVLLCSLRPLA